MFSFYEIILLFFIYSFMGWVWEVILSIFEHHKLINRGFLIGPLLPIYGCGGFIATVFFTGLLDKSDTLIENIIYIFICTTIICSILEYFTSWFMEKLFHTRWWDYSKIPFNLNGRICLFCSLGFGAGCTAALLIVNPFLRSVFDSLNLSFNIIRGLDLLFILIFIVDIYVSFKIINNFKHISDNVDEDSTEKITSMVKKTIINNYNLFYRRLVESFPNIKVQNRLSILRNRILDEQKKLEKAAYKLDVRRDKVKNMEKELRILKGDTIVDRVLNVFKKK